MSNENYAVVEFLDEKTVEVLPKIWIKSGDDVGFHL